MVLVLLFVLGIFVLPAVCAVLPDARWDHIVKPSSELKDSVRREG